MKKLILGILFIAGSLFGATDTMSVSSDGTVNPRTIVFVFPTNVNFNAQVGGLGWLEMTNGVSGGVTNRLSAIHLFQRLSDGAYLTGVTTNSGAIGFKLVGSNDGSTFQLITASGNADMTMNNSLGTLTLMAGKYSFDANGFSAPSGNGSFGGTFNTSSNLTVGGNTTLGDGSSRTITFNAGTLTSVGAFNWNLNTIVVTNGAVFFNSPTNVANGVSRIYVNGNIRADNYFYNILSTPYSVTGTNSIDFSTNMVVNITGVTAGLTLTSANLMAGRSVDVIFQGTSSNIILTLPTNWTPESQTFAVVVTNKTVIIHALSLGSTDSTVLYSITQQP